MTTVTKMLLCLMLVMAVGAGAQTRLSGVVQGVDAKQGLPLVELFRKVQADTVLSRSVYADAAGGYLLQQVEAGTYLLRVSLQGGQTYYPDFINVRACNCFLTLDTITLVPASSKTMSEITVTASRKPLFEQDREKLIFNVENSPSNIGTNGLEVLQRIPGVYVDPGGGIQINGQSGSAIKINGRLLNMGASDRAELLRNIDISQVRRIEISTVPGASQDAAGSAGVIDILLKKGVKLGWNGNVSFTRRQADVASRNTATLSLNYGDARWSWYASASYSLRNSYDSLDIRRYVRAVDTLILQQANNRYPYHTTSLTTGAAYQLNEKSEIGVTLNSNSTIGKTEGVSNAAIMPGTAASATRTTNARNDYRNSFRFSSVNANYTLKPDAYGSHFSINADHAWYRIGNQQQAAIREAKGTGLDTYVRTGQISNSIELSSADAQYFKHVDTTWILKSGVKWARSGTTNQSLYEVHRNGQTSVEADRSHAFRYGEKILAGFLEVERAYRKYVFITGLRAEHTDFSGYTLNPKQPLVNYKRTDLFPFAYLSRRTFKNQNVSLVYSRRIDRPSFNDLNPMIVYYDPYTYTSGNPRLLPQFTGKLELTYNLSRLPVLKIGYSQTRRALTNVTYQNDSTLTTYKTVDNLARREAWTISTIVPIQIKKKFLSINYFSYGWNLFEGVYGKTPIQLRRRSFSYYNNTTYSFDNGLVLEAGGFYNHGGLYGLFDLDDIWTANLGVQKPLLRKRLMLRLNVTDAFFSQKSRFVFQLDNVDIQARQVTDTRALSLSLTYRFGIKSKGVADRGSSIEVEKSRVKTAEH